MPKVSIPSKCRYCGWSFPMTKPGTSTDELDWFCSKITGTTKVEGNHKPPKECPLRAKPPWKVSAK